MLDYMYKGYEWNLDDVLPLKYVWIVVYRTKIIFII